MKVNIIQNGEEAVVDIAGRLDTVTSVEFGNNVQDLIQSDTKQIVLNCKELSYVSSAGLRLFLTLQKAMRSKGGTLCLRNVCPDVMEVFNISGFSSILKIE